MKSDRDSSLYKQVKFATGPVYQLLGSDDLFEEGEVSHAQLTGFDTSSGPLPLTTGHIVLGV